MSQSTAPAEVTPEEVTKLTVQPSEIEIGGANRQQQLQVTATTSAGRSIDATHLSQISTNDDRVAALNGTVVRGRAEGKTKLTIRFAGREVAVPVIVRDFKDYPSVHFANDIVPLFSKLGCNSGGCHGKQSGQNGFKLSVFGFDPKADFEALTREGRSRRVFPGDPDSSLLVLKATGKAAHGGGRRAELGSPDELLLSQWVRQGMPWGTANAAKVTGIEIEPNERVLDMRADQQVLVTALFGDGSRRDVTSATTYTSNSEVVAEVDATGHIRTGKVPGEAAITVNYMGHVAAVRVVVPRANSPKNYPDVPVRNRIDELVWAKLRKLGIVPSPLCDDSKFLRRVFVDAIGTLPSAEEVTKFLDDDRSDKRDRVIDSVLKRDEYADYWTQRWADVLLVDRATLGDRGAYQFHQWLRQQMVENQPYDRWAREILTASGNSAKYGPVNFFRAVRTKEELTRAVSQAFLGIRMDCAQCHHHPFEKWGQHDFYGMSGFFNGIQLKKLNSGREMIYHAGFRQTTMPLTKEVVPTKPPGGAIPDGLQIGDPRVVLAKWVTRPNNPYFARLAVNRIWKNYMGRGLVEPVDDIRSTNPATNEPLLTYLAEQLVANHYDLKSIMRQIMRSRVYQLSSVPNATNFDDNQNFSHHIEKRLPANVLLDAICEVTGVPENFAGLPRGTRAIELWDNRLPSYFLDTFGRSERKNPCECGASTEPTMAQTLHMMNAPEIDEKIGSAVGRVASLLARNRSNDQILTNLTLTAVGRLPSEKERKIAARLFAQDSKKQAAEDLLWTLLNSYDFLFVK